MTTFKIKYVCPSDEELDFDDYFEMTYEEFLKLSDEKRKSLEEEVLLSLQSEKFVKISSMIYETSTKHKMGNL